MALKRAKAHWMGQWVNVYAYRGKPISLRQKPLQSFRAGSRNMPDRMAEWASRNGYKIVNLKRDKDGKLRVFL